MDPTSPTFPISSQVLREVQLTEVVFAEWDKCDPFIILVYLRIVIVFAQWDKCTTQAFLRNPMCLPENIEKVK